MADGNVRVKEKVELALDGRQIASIVVGSLVLLGVVFALGVSVGRQLVPKAVEAARPDALAALDRPVTPAAPPARDESLTFHDRLVKDGAAEPPLAAKPPAPAPAPLATPPPAVAAAPVAEAAKPAAKKADAPAKPAEAAKKPEATAKKAEAPKAGWAVQLGAAQDRAEAEKLAARYKEKGPKVEAADVPGKGRWYRVRVGGFDSRDAAERFLRELGGGAGKAMVVAAR